MRDKIAEAVVKGLLFNKTGNDIADAILALEVPGKTKCIYKMSCNFNKGGICKKAESRWPSPDCVDQIPATIADIING